MTKRKKILILLPAALVLVVVAWQGLRYWWNYGYSRGSRTGIIRKMSTKGSPLCKYLSAELVLIGTQPGQNPEIWEFTVDEKDDHNPLVIKLHDAEKSAKPVTIDYRQDRGKWWACAPTEYYAVGVE
jgi:hypothetical protein